MSTEQMREALEAIELALRMNIPAAEILGENSPIRDGIRAALTAPAAEPEPVGEVFIDTQGRPVPKLYGNVSLTDGVKLYAAATAAEVPEAMGDAEVDRLLPDPDGTAEANATRVELAPEVWGSEYEEVDAWSRPLIRQFASALNAARDAQWQSTRLRGGVPEGWKLVPVEPTTDMLRAAVNAVVIDTQAIEEGDHISLTWNEVKDVFAAMLTAAPQAPAAALDAGVNWLTVAEHGMPDFDEEVLGGLWYTDPWLKPEVATRFMWGLCCVVKDDRRDFKDGKRWHTFGPSHNQITHWARLNKPAMSAQAGKGGAA